MVEVCDVHGKQERGQDCSLRSPCTADYFVCHEFPSPHILWPVSEVIQDPGCEVLVHPCQLHKRTHQRAEMDEDQPLQGLHQV